MKRQFEPQFHNLIQIKIIKLKYLQILNLLELLSLFKLSLLVSFFHFIDYLSFFLLILKIIKISKKKNVAPLLIQSTRLTSTSIQLSWQRSEGATQYRLIQIYSNGTLINSNDFENVNSTNIYNLELLVQYLFTIYSGNSNGFDLSEGRGVLVSTDSSFFFFFDFFFLSFSFFKFILIEIDK